MRSQVRVYVLDGSESMIGRRARVRDAIVLAEELVDLEEATRRWRFRHVTTVERVIGGKRPPGHDQEPQSDDVVEPSLEMVVARAPM